MRGALDKNTMGLNSAHTCPDSGSYLAIEPATEPATGGLDVDAIPNEITTCIILNSSKSSILAQAINIGAKGVN